MERSQVVTLMRQMHGAGKRAALLSIEEGVRELQANVATLDLADIERGILHFAARLTWAPRSNRSTHLEPLRALGLSDAEIHDVVNVCCCFSYMNRLADGLGVKQAASREKWAIELFGEEAWQEHLKWSAGDPS
jgi:uncharacterized peroxidase-related enzyme